MAGTLTYGKDWWCDSGPLINVTDHTLGRHHTPVSSIISQNSGWNLSEIPSNLHQLVSNIPLAITDPPKDSITWSPSGSGKFSVGSCYKFILSEKSVINDADLNWDWIWKLKVPSRVSTFIRTLSHNKILSNPNCVIRNISSNPFCKHYNRLESSAHIIKDCRISYRSGICWDFWLWTPQVVILFFFGLSPIWKIRKLNIIVGFQGIVFASAIWQNWKARINYSLRMKTVVPTGRF